jgi:hypothetical protein
MKTQLLEVFNTISHKHISNHITREHPEIRIWIDELTSDIQGLRNFNQRIRYVLFGDLPACSESTKPKRWISLSDGYGYCGRASECTCARASVSSKVSATKRLLSDEQRDEINERRRKTNLDRYGVSNVGQIDEVRERHKLFYQDQDQVAETVSKMRSTMLERYGVENPQQSPDLREKSKATLLERYGVDNINKTAESRERLSKQSKISWIKRKSSNHDYHKLNDKFRRLSNVEFTTVPDDYKGTVGQIWYGFRCLECDSTFDTWISCGHIPVCKICHPAKPWFKSGEETEVFDYLRSIGVDAYQRDRKIIAPLELDIVCPAQKIAIEYCGLYWHSESSSGKGKDYHINKMISCNEQGYRLITIFSDEWTLKKEIVKSKLAAIFGYASAHLGARQCDVIELDAGQAMRFYDDHHLQGGIGAELHLGLSHREMIVGAMSFGKPRVFASGIRDNHEYELIRYATSCHVRGGAGKLLKHFERMRSPKSIMSYADARWSDGNMYEALGFTNIQDKLKPGYWYTQNYATREHRFAYIKSRLITEGYDPLMSEWEIMQSRGYDRIWDCGQLKYQKVY